MKVFVAVLPVVLTIVTPTLLLAKGDTVKITIEGPQLGAPIEITDPNVRQFNVWSGPGTSVNGIEGEQGFIVDWTNGAVATPIGLPQYKVSFYEGCDPTRLSVCRTAEPSLRYVVFYDFDPATQEGFVYLPGRHDEFARLNMGTIYRGPGYEGHWLRATKVWDKFVRPFIARATGNTAAR